MANSYEHYDPLIVRLYGGIDDYKQLLKEGAFADVYKYSPRNSRGDRIALGLIYQLLINVGLEISTDLGPNMRLGLGLAGGLAISLALEPRIGLNVPILEHPNTARQTSGQQG